MSSLPTTVAGHFDDLRKTLSTDLDAHVPSIAYHYTGADAAKNILESGKLWATDAGFLNDRTEWSHGHELIIGALESKKNKSPEFVAAIDYLKNRVAARIDRKFWYMIISFSTSRGGDDLALWRPYGDDGRGCNIGIDLAQCPGVPGAAQFCRMLYDDEEKRRLALRAVTAHIESALGLIGRFESREIGPAMRLSLEIHAGVFASSCKHAAFVAEEEVRLVRPGAGKVFEAELRYRRTKAFDRVPFIELDVRPAIVEVVLGPRYPPDGEAEWGAWLHSKGWDRVRVRRSEVPYGR